MRATTAKRDSVTESEIIARARREISVGTRRRGNVIERNADGFEEEVLCVIYSDQFVAVSHMYV